MELALSWNIVLKMLAGLVVLLVYIYLSGKGALAPISALDQVGNIVLGAIIGGPIYNPDVSVVMLLGVAGMWAAMLLGVRYLSFKRWSVKNVVDGKSIMLMQDGKVLDRNFSMARISVRDFIMLLHQRGHPNLDELRNVWFEYNGQMTVVTKGDEAMAIVVIENGQIDYDNLAVIKQDENWLREEIERQGFTLEKIFIAEWHDNRLWIYPYMQQTS